jgi:hypothetical protein
VYPDHFSSPWSRPNIPSLSSYLVLRSLWRARQRHCSISTRKLSAPHYYLLCLLIALPPFATLSARVIVDSQAYLSSCRDVICLGGGLDKKKNVLPHHAGPTRPQLQFFPHPFPLPATSQKLGGPPYFASKASINTARKIRSPSRCLRIPLSSHVVRSSLARLASIATVIPSERWKTSECWDPGEG